MNELRDRVAVVTGAASGIGFALAECFCSAGMKVVLADVEESALERARSDLERAGHPVLAVPADVARPESVASLAERAFGHFGAVHVLCNNAGVAEFGYGYLWEKSLEEWQWVMNVNFWGVLHGIRSFVPRMLAQDCEGHIVNTASMAGLLDGGSIYGVSKHAVVSLSETLYRHLAMVRAKLAVSVLCPGLVDTRIWDAQRTQPPALRSPELRSGPQLMPPQLREMLAGGFAPREVADAVLAGIRAKRFLVVLAQDELLQRMRERAERIVAQGDPRTAPVMDPD